MRVYLNYERGEGGERQREGGRRGGKGGKQRDMRKKEGVKGGRATQLLLLENKSVC